MNTIEKIQFKERLSGTLLRLGWLVAVLTFVPTFLYVAYGTMGVGRVLFMALLVIAAMCTLFLLFLSEGFRNLFNADSVNVLPALQKVYQNYKVLIFILLAVGLILAVLTILLAIKENNGKSSRGKVISSGVMTALLIVGAIVYFGTKSKIQGA